MCDIIGCDNDAEYMDPYGDQLCSDCVQKDIDEGGDFEWEDYEKIT